MNKIISPKPVFKKTRPTTPWVLCERKECRWNHEYKNGTYCDKISILITGKGCDGYSTKKGER